MEIAYISGPYRAKTIWGVKCNIEKAGMVALEYWRKGYAVICPHKNTAFFDGALNGSCDADVWIKGDLEMVKRSDVIVMMPDWVHSKGAVEEHGQALRCGIEIIYHKD
jgi:hypothetical protein